VISFDTTGATDPGISVDVSSGQMKITIKDKLQPGSHYKWADVFKVVNKGYFNGTDYTPYSAITLDYTDPTPASGITVKLTQAATSGGPNSLDSGVGLNSLTLNNTTTPSVNVDVQIDVADTATLGGKALRYSLSFQIRRVELNS
jgi:hypothetical protein